MARGRREVAEPGRNRESLYMTYGTSRSTSRFPRGFRVAYYIHLIMSLIRVVHRRAATTRIPLMMR